ncbi:MAG: porphobilinogen synthase [Firmicutes bacterium HGW-Firmicutes-7]|nr:MAG: porphobilinogen synthase [Firmicutes bacterium HGW-Firmicutes-7]
MNNQKPTRLRGNAMVRRLVRENSVSLDQIIYPVFVVEGEGIREEISSMKDQYHLSVDALVEEVKQLQALGIQNLLIFGTPDIKDSQASSGYDKDGVIQRAVKALKAHYPELYIITDICLCPFKDDGHCCVYDAAGKIDREKSLELLGKIALSHVWAGADMIAPSDMMDGRIGYIRQLLDRNGSEHIPIMAYSAKFASSFYGPFREALHSAPTFGDRKMYQMDPSNGKEAIKEMTLDFEEGADVLMVKPAMPYLDVIKAAKDTFLVPIAAYQVSGEYAMLRTTIDAGLIDEKAIYESLLSIRRAGADMIITYFAKELKRLINEVKL